MTIEYSCYQSDHVIVVSLLQEGETPVYIASYSCRTDVLKCLCENNADLNVADKVSYQLMIHVIILLGVDCFI